MDMETADTAAAAATPLPASGAAGPAPGGGAAEPVGEAGGAEAAMDEAPGNAVDLATDCSTAGALLAICPPHACT